MTMTIGSKESTRSAPDPFETRSPFELVKDVRRTRLLIGACDVIFWIAFPILTPFVVMALTVPAWQTTVTLVVPSLSVPISRLVRRMATTSRVNQGAFILLVYFLIMIGLNGVLIDGLFPAVAIAYAPFVLVGGLVLERFGRYMIGLLASALWIAGKVVVSEGVIQGVEIPSALLWSLEVVIVGSMFIMLVWLSELALVDLRRALDDATFDLVQANRQLERASRMKSQFTARTSHELRTPLSTIIVITDLALRKAYGAINNDMSENLQRVLSNAWRLKGLIDDILDLSKIEAGGIQLVKASFPPQNLLTGLKSNLIPEAEEKGLEFKTQLSLDLPSEIVGDEGRVSQIVTNLVSNAIKFTQEGEIEVSLDAVAKKQWRIRVRDTGRGIHEENLQSIFDEFSQEITAVDEHGTKGTGLGLAISRALARQMGGDITVTSKLGKGSTFEVVLPLVQPAADGEQAEKHQVSGGN